MPELPDLTVYREQLQRLVGGVELQKILIAHPFLLRSVDPGVAEIEGHIVQSISLIGKRIVFEFDGDVFAVIHLMIAGRFQWSKEKKPIPRKRGLARFDFSTGSLLLTEAGTRRRASLTLIRGRTTLTSLDPGGIDVCTADITTFGEVLARENHTLKRSLTDPRFFAGIGNSYSDEILHHAKLSPFKQTKDLDDTDLATLYESCRSILSEWTDRLRAQAGEVFPAKVTAFHKEMAVHGKYEKPCPVCTTPIQRIRYAENECNYCPTCQTSGKLLADRALSRILKSDWPKTIEQLEELKSGPRT
jgi:formamidopyrimidine-DNA glycosylase